MESLGSPCYTGLRIPHAGAGNRLDPRRLQGGGRRRSALQALQKRSEISAAAGLSNCRLHMVGAVLGHRSMQATERYAHLQDGATREASAQIAERIARAMGSGAAEKASGEVVELDTRR